MLDPDFPRQRRDPTRYFLVSYRGDGILGCMNIMSKNGIFNDEEITQTIEKTTKAEKLVIVSVFELTKEDWEYAHKKEIENAKRSKTSSSSCDGTIRDSEGPKCGASADSQ